MMFMKQNILSLGLLVASTVCAIYPAIADDFPIKGAWVYVGSGDSPEIRKKACKTYERLG